MAHFAQLDENSTVVQVIVINNEVVGNLPFPESEPIGVAFCQSLYGADTNWVQTSYNGSFRARYAGIGYIYFEKEDAFIPFDPANTDYQQYLAWLAEGNEPLPANPQPE